MIPVKGHRIRSQETQGFQLGTVGRRANPDLTLRVKEVHLLHRDAGESDAEGGPGTHCLPSLNPKNIKTRLAFCPMGLHQKL
jgi:hypothetical protein